MNPSSEIPIRTQGTRREPIVFWFSVHAEKLGSTVVGFIPMFATKTLITNVTKVVRSKNSLKCSTANKFRKQRLSLILDQKLLTMAAPKGLLCAVASERRRAKWKVKTESVGCGSAWKRLTGRTRTACSNYSLKSTV